MSAAMTDIELIGYCEIHCTTERALFAAENVNRMIELAGNPPGFKRQSGWVSAHEEMQELCDLARARIAPPTAAIAPPVAAGSVNALQRFAECTSLPGVVPDRVGEYVLRYEAITWGAQQRHEGFQEGVRQLQYERDNLQVLAIQRRERAEKAEARVKDLEAEDLAMHRKLASETLRADQGWARYEAANRAKNDLERERGSKQAIIDRLMLEYCPDEMTAEQVKEWGEHQVRAE